MKFVEISENMKVYPGEYVLHVPTQKVVLCGAFMRNRNLIRALGNGKTFVDKIQAFKKIEMQKKDRVKKKRGCGCKGKSTK